MRLFGLSRQEDGPESIRGELEAYVRDFRLSVEVHVKTINGDLLSAVSYMTRTKTMGDLLGGMSYMTKPDADGVKRGVSSVSASLFPTWRRNIVDPEPIPLPRDHSAILPMFSAAKLPFPEQPPCGNGQIARPDIDTSVALTPRHTGTPKQAPSSCSILDERGVLPRADTDQSPHGASPDLPMGSSLEEEELAVAVGLNDIIRSESTKAELVLTNLPDMPPGESLHGYFELVEELTKGLPRCLLVRGTATEVITAFT